MDDRLRAWPDRTRLQVVGNDQMGDGIRWLNVCDPAGNTVCVPAQYVERLVHNKRSMRTKE